MANFVYGKAKQAFAAAQINWTSDDIYAQLIDAAAYTASESADEFLSDIPAGARIGSPVLLSGKTNVLGVCDCADWSHTGLSSAPTIEAVVIYKSTGTESTSRLIVYIDSAAGLPVSAGATAVDIAVDSGANKLFRL